VTLIDDCKFTNLYIQKNDLIITVFLNFEIDVFFKYYGIRIVIKQLSHVYKATNSAYNCVTFSEILSKPIYLLCLHRF